MQRVEQHAPVRRRSKFFQRKTTGDIVFDFINYAFLTLFVITIVYPFWNTFLFSFAQAEDTNSIGLTFWINSWNLTAYKFIFGKMNILVAYANSIFRTVFGTFLTVFACMALAYPLAKRQLPGRTAITIYLLITMFFSGGLIPTYLLIRSLGLIDNRLAYLLPAMVTGFNVIIMRNFLMTLDRAYEESAFIDGASYFRIFASIVLPLSKPVVATVALWTAVWHWNSWFDGLVYIRSESKIVLQMVLRKIIVDAEAAFSNAIADFRLDEELDMPTTAVKSAVTIITIGPIVAVYPFLQKYFIHGIFIGSLKG